MAAPRMAAPRMAAPLSKGRQSPALWGFASNLAGANQVGGSPGKKR